MRPKRTGGSRESTLRFSHEDGPAAISSTVPIVGKRAHQPGNLSLWSIPRIAPRSIPLHNSPIPLRKEKERGSAHGIWLLRVRMRERPAPRNSSQSLKNGRKNVARLYLATKNTLTI